MTVSKSIAKKGSPKPATTAVKPATKKAKSVLSERIRQGVADVFEWFKESPASWDRLERAIRLLDTLVSSNAATFEEALREAFKQDNPRHVLTAKMLEVAKIDSKTPWSELVAIVGVL